MFRVVFGLEALGRYRKSLEGYVVQIAGFFQHNATFVLCTDYLSVFHLQSPGRLGRHAAERAAKGGHPDHYLPCGDEASSLVDHWSLRYRENLHSGPSSQAGS